MKINYLLIIGLAILFSCNSNSSKSVKLNSDSLALEDVEAKLLIVPGKSVGRYFIGQNMSIVDSLKGRPDFGDAAMGKAWAIWYGAHKTGNKKNEIAIYSTYADTSMTSKAVKQIRVISGRFQTADGLNNGNLFSSFAAKYTDFTKVFVYVDTALGDTIQVYDSKVNGIAVEFLRDISRAITIHPKGEALNQSYYTLHPEWKVVL